MSKINYYLGSDERKVLRSLASLLRHQSRRGISDNWLQSGSRSLLWADIPKNLANPGKSFSRVADYLDGTVDVVEPNAVDPRADSEYTLEVTAGDVFATTGKVNCPSAFQGLKDQSPPGADCSSSQGQLGCLVSVYIDTGVVFEYRVADVIKGREHAAAIIRGGYRHTAQGSGDLEWFAPHRIDKVKVQGGGLSSGYQDVARAT